MEDYLKDIEFLEEPLVGINQSLHNVGKRSEMSDEELRAWIQQIRTLRESRQSFKAALSGKSKGESKGKAEKLFDSFDGE